MTQNHISSQPDPAHGTFTIDRTFDADCGLVFQAWSDPEVKARWFIGPETWSEAERTADFRVGGIEILEGRFESGMRTVYTARFHSIVPDRLLVYAYDMHIDGAHLSVSLASVQFTQLVAGTKMTYTEQAVYLDGEDGSASRKNGVTAHFDLLERVI